MQTHHTHLVYGEINNNLIFIPEEEALRSQKIWHAINNANTWQDFIDLTSEEEFDQIVFEILEFLDHGNLFAEYKMGQDLSTYVEGLHLPQPDDLFTTEVLPGFEEGEFMPRADQEIIGWLPEEMLENIGEIKTSEEGIFYYKIEPKHIELVIQTFDAAGFKCIPNQKLIEAAEGIAD
jgi:hypothetical protein